MVHFGLKSVAEVVAERRNVVHEKYTGRGASSRRFEQKKRRNDFFLWAVQHRCLLVLLVEMWHDKGKTTLGLQRLHY